MNPQPQTDDWKSVRNAINDRFLDIECIYMRDYAHGYMTEAEYLELTRREKLRRDHERRAALAKREG